MMPNCPRCGARPPLSETFGRGPGGRVKCRHCGSPLVLVWRTGRAIVVLFLAAGLGVLVWSLFPGIEGRILALAGLLLLLVPLSGLLFRLEVRDVACDAQPLEDEDKGSAAPSGDRHTDISLS